MVKEYHTPVRKQIQSNTSHYATALPGDIRGQPSGESNCASPSNLPEQDYIIPAPAQQGTHTPHAYRNQASGMRRENPQQMPGEDNQFKRYADPSESALNTVQPTVTGAAGQQLQLDKVKDVFRAAHSMSFSQPVRNSWKPSTPTTVSGQMSQSERMSNIAPLVDLACSPKTPSRQREARANDLSINSTHNKESPDALSFHYNTEGFRGTPAPKFHQALNKPTDRRRNESDSRTTMPQIEYSTPAGDAVKHRERQHQLKPYSYEREGCDDEDDDDDNDSVSAQEGDSYSSRASENDTEQVPEGSQTPTLPALTDNSEGESVSEGQAPVFKVRRSFSASGKMLSSGVEKFIKTRLQNMKVKEQGKDIDSRNTEKDPSASIKCKNSRVVRLEQLLEENCAENGNSSNESLQEKEKTVNSVHRAQKSSIGADKTSQPQSQSSRTMETNLSSKLEKLESLYEDLVMYLGVGNQSRRRHSIASASSSQMSHSFRRSCRPHHTHSSSEQRSNHKRFQRIESHIVTLARSVAHISSEMSSLHNLTAEMKRLRADVESLKLSPLQQSVKPSISALEYNASNEPMENSERTQRISKLTKLKQGILRSSKRFFGQEPPLMKMFLKQLGYEKYLSAFEGERIGMVELPYMSEEQLKHIGIPLGPRMRLLEEVRSMRHSIPQVSHMRESKNRRSRKV